MFRWTYKIWSEETLLLKMSQQLVMVRTMFNVWCPFVQNQKRGIQVRLSKDKHCSRRFNVWKTCSKIDVWVYSMFDKMVFDLSPLATIKCCLFFLHSQSRDFIRHKNCWLSEHHAWAQKRWMIECEILTVQVLTPSTVIREIR